MYAGDDPTHRTGGATLGRMAQVNDANTRKNHTFAVSVCTASPNPGQDSLCSGQINKKSPKSQLRTTRDGNDGIPPLNLNLELKPVGRKRSAFGRISGAPGRHNTRPFACVRTAFAPHPLNCSRDGLVRGRVRSTRGTGRATLGRMAQVSGAITRKIALLRSVLAPRPRIQARTACVRGSQLR